MTECRLCKTNYDTVPDVCFKCGFPFNAGEAEQGKFIGQQILKKGKISNAKDSLGTARVILFLIGGLNLLAYLMQYRYIVDPLALVLTFGLIAIFLAGGIFIKKYPLPSIIVPLSILLFLYGLTWYLNPAAFINGIIWKMVYVGGLIYALYNVLTARKIQQESDYLHAEKFDEKKDTLKDDLLDQF